MRKTLGEKHEERAKSIAKHSMLVEKKVDEKAKQQFNRKPFYLTDTATTHLKAQISD